MGQNLLTRNWPEQEGKGKGKIGGMKRNGIWGHQSQRKRGNVGKEEIGGLEGIYLNGNFENLNGPTAIKMNGGQRKAEKRRARYSNFMVINSC
jgi:hypothetical protein